MEEDLEEAKCVIFPWALGKDWHHQVADFLHQRDKLWARMGFRAVVSRQCCEEVKPRWHLGVGERGWTSHPHLPFTLFIPGHGQGAIPLGLDSGEAPPPWWGSEERPKGPGPPPPGPWPLATPLFPL